MLNVPKVSLKKILASKYYYTLYYYCCLVHTLTSCMGNQKESALLSGKSSQ